MTHTAWAFHWLMGLDNVTMILSGMSTMDQILIQTILVFLLVICILGSMISGIILE